jgi:hypothetical protein
MFKIPVILLEPFPAAIRADGSGAATRSDFVLPEDCFLLLIVTALVLKRAE